MRADEKEMTRDMLDKQLDKGMSCNDHALITPAEAIETRDVRGLL